MTVPPSPVLSASQLARLGALGEERTARVDEVDVRSASTKRCATAVGEGAMAVQFVHRRFAALAPAHAGGESGQLSASRRSGR